MVECCLHESQFSFPSICLVPLIVDIQRTPSNQEAFQQNSHHILYHRKNTASTSQIAICVTFFNACKLLRWRYQCLFLTLNTIQYALSWFMLIKDSYVPQNFRCCETVIHWFFWKLLTSTENNRTRLGLQDLNHILFPSPLQVVRKSLKWHRLDIFNHLQNKNKLKERKKSKRKKW